MYKTRLAAGFAAAALAAFAAGCSDTTTTNTNTANANANAGIINSTSTTTTTTNTNYNANANANTNARGSFNANISKEEYERTKDDYTARAKEAGDKIGSGLNDGWLWVKAKAALAGVDDLRDSTINVDVENETITLRGTVASQDQVKKADDAVKGIEGKKGVKNMLKVSADAGAGGGNSNNANRNANTNKG